jgi:hypothetical protein
MIVCLIRLFSFRTILLVLKIYSQTGPEIAWSMSGGGFSNYFPRPSYQTNAVNRYLQASQGILILDFPC